MRFSIFFLFVSLALISCNPDKVQSKFERISSKDSGIDFKNILTPDLKSNLNILGYEYFYNGGGVGILDFNKDGFQDIFLTGNMVEDKLYLNKGNMSFEDVTQSAGITSHDWSTGVSIVDINQDGWDDIYVSRGGPLKQKYSQFNVLYVNQKDGTFIESSRSHNLNDGNLSTQAVFFDLDNDNDLDCYVLNESPSNKISYQQVQQIESNEALLPLYSGRLLINNNGTFTDVTKSAGVLRYGYGLGVFVNDINDDGWLDFYVCNDYQIPDFMFINQGDGTFKDEIKERTKHTSWFSMGIDGADINNDLKEDFFLAEMASTDHIRGKTLMAPMNADLFYFCQDSLSYQTQYMFNALNLNNGDGTYSDVASVYGVLASDWSWAPLFADFDNDGYQDLFITNGFRKYVNDNDFRANLRELAKKGSTVSEEEKIEIYNSIPEVKIRNAMFKNFEGKKFKDQGIDWGLEAASYSNGAAYADLDNDGDLDLIVSNIDEEVSIYQNNITSQNYLRINLVSNNPLQGTKVICYTSDGNTQMRTYNRIRGFQSSVEPYLHFGLAKHNTVDSVVVKWFNKREQTIQNVPANQTLNVNYIHSLPPKGNKKPRNSNIQVVEKIDFKHQENTFNDYDKEVLLPYKQSTLGPFLSKGDINNDGLEDIYIAGARGQAGILYQQNNRGEFLSTSNATFEADAASEDLGSLFFDADMDGDQDLYVVSGGNSFDPDDKLLQDRLYLNDGKGNFKKDSEALPSMITSGSNAVSTDLDKDGDNDLIVAGRLVPGNYPYAANSYILINEDGKFRDATSEWNNDFYELGLVNDIICTDLNGDQKEDVIIAGEWMPIKVFINTGTSLKDETDTFFPDGSPKGWWLKIRSMDVDQDGDQDFIVGNVGLNTKFKASKEKPFEVIANDFDDNGVLDIVLTKKYKGKTVPTRGKECSTEQMPFVSEKYPTYKGFAEASITDILGEEKVEEALKLSATEFESIILINDNGTFKTQKLPIEVSAFPLYGISEADVNGDDINDLILSGNLYNMEIETPRLDAGTGLILTNDGKGNFSVDQDLSIIFKADGDAKDQIIVKNANGHSLLFVANNNAGLSQFEILTK